MTAPRFGLEQVVLDGQKSRTKEALIARGGVKMGQNLFSIDMDGVENKMLGDPYVKSVTVLRRLPDTLLVHIEERVPAAIVVIGVDAFLVTRDGETFKRLEVGDPPDLPVITGLRPALAETTMRASPSACGARWTSRSTTSSHARLEDDPAGDPRRPGMAMSLFVGSQGAGRRPSCSAARRSGASSSRPPACRRSSSAAGRGPTPSCSTATSRPERVVARVR